MCSHSLKHSLLAVFLAFVFTISSGTMAYATGVSNVDRSVQEKVLTTTEGETILLNSGEIERDTIEYHGNVIMEGEVFHVDRSIVDGCIEAIISDAGGNVIAREENEAYKANYSNQDYSVGDIRQIMVDAKGWSGWSSNTVTKKYQKAVAIIVAILTAYCPYATVAALIGVAGVIVTQNDYKYMTIKIEHRFMADSKYLHIQERYTVWIRKTKKGKKKHIWGPTTFSQKRPL